MKPQVLLIFNACFEECSAMLKGVAHHQRTHRPWMVSLDDQASPDASLEWVRRNRWDGIISRHTTSALVNLCAKLGLPLVDLDDTPASSGVAKIRPDNTAIGHMGAEYFLERRFRQFAFCGFSGRSWSNERRDGFIEALGLAGHRCELFEAEFPPDSSLSLSADQTGALAVWLKGLPRESALMACNDYCALQIVRAAQVVGLNIPEELAVLGANNDALRCELSNPSISSVAINAFEAGREAAEHLDRLMAGENSAVLDRRIEPAGVVTRKSTDVLALQDKDVASALSYIREHACQGITVDEVLGRVFVSRSQLEHKFRRYIGRSPQAEIRRVQVSRISQLLAETDLPLKQISEKTGFIHVEYMSVVFKRVTGDTPGRYRKNTQAHERDRALAC